jgi:hypothetical protein
MLLELLVLTIMSNTRQRKFWRSVWDSGVRANQELAVFATCFMLVSCLAYYSTLKMQATCFSETSTTQRYIPWRYNSARTGGRVGDIKRRLEWLGLVIRMDETSVAKNIFGCKPQRRSEVKKASDWNDWKRQGMFIFMIDIVLSRCAL